MTLCSRNPAGAAGRRVRFAGATFWWEKYLAHSLVWDHENCLGRHQKFMKLDQPGVDRFGHVNYLNGEPWWVCPTCFDDFDEELGWRGDPSGPAPPEST